MTQFWGKCTDLECKELNNDVLMLLNYLSVLVPDMLFLIEHGFSHTPIIPTISFININLIKRFIHIFFWYWGYFYRMGKIVKPGSLYEKFYHIQLLSWAGANMFPLTKRGEELTDKIHYISTGTNFISFAIVKILFCKQPKVFIWSFIGLIASIFGNRENCLRSEVCWNSWSGFFERCCVYSAMHTNPRLSL
tara:strand:+ start:418 stop:993 length:576 start_codon:yes stop_codon:yes gene_type:complete